MSRNKLSRDEYVAKVLQGVCPNCEKSENLLIDNVIVYPKDIKVIGHCEGCAEAWQFWVEVVGLHTKKGD